MGVQIKRPLVIANDPLDPPFQTHSLLTLVPHSRTQKLKLLLVQQSSSHLESLLHVGRSGKMLPSVDEPRAGPHDPDESEDDDDIVHRRARDRDLGREDKGDRRQGGEGQSADVDGSSEPAERELSGAVDGLLERALSSPGNEGDCRIKET